MNKAQDSPRPDSWESFFELADRAGVPDDFLADRGDEQPQDRDSFPNDAEG